MSNYALFDTIRFHFPFLLKYITHRPEQRVLKRHQFLFSLYYLKGYRLCSI